MIATLAGLLAMTLPAPKTPTSLVSDASVVQPGVPFQVALRMQMASGWHSYYLNPGEAGQATSIKWSLPVGYKAGPIQWPVPMREDFEGIASFVYEGDLWLLTTITPPVTANPGPLKLAAHVDWLLCSTACVPQSSDLTLGLTVAAKATKNTASAPMFAKAEGRIPIPASFTVSAKTSGKSVVLDFAPPSADPTGSTFIPADADAFGAAQGTLTVAGGQGSMKVPLSEYAKKAPVRLKGILIVANGSDRTPYAIDVPISR